MKMRSGTPEKKARAPRPARRRGTTRYARLLQLGGASSSLTVAVSQAAEGVCKLVVLKTVHEEQQSDRQVARRLLDEARLTARMNHPNVVQVHAVHLKDGLPVIVLEYLAGQSLATVLDAARDLPEFTLELRVAIVARLLSGLQYVHRLRDFDGRPLHVVHGAVAPQHVVVTYDGQVKLVDFGRATVGFSSAEGQAARSSLPPVAPEPAEGERDCRADVFSAGVILWEMVAKQRLSGGARATAVAGRPLEGSVPRLRDAVPAVDLELDRICAMALAPQPRERYRSAGEMRDELERFLAGRGGYISDSALGALVSKACRELRMRQKKAIDAHLSELGLSLTQPEPDAALASIARRWLRVARRSGALRWLVARWPAALRWPLVAHWPGALRWPLVARWSSALRWPLAVRRRGAAYAIGGALVAGLMLSSLMRSRETLSEEPTEQVTLASQTIQNGSPWHGAGPGGEGAAEPAVRVVNVEVSVEPRQAVLYLDGQRLSSNPLVAAMVWDPVVHTLHGEAQGFERFTESFRLDSDVRIKGALQASAVARRGSSGEVSFPAQRAPSVRSSRVVRRASKAEAGKGVSTEHRAPSVRILFGDASRLTGGR